MYRGYPVEQLAEIPASSKSATCCCTVTCRRRTNSSDFDNTIRATRCSTRACSTSSRVSATTPIRWRCCRLSSVRCRPTTMTRWTPRNPEHRDIFAHRILAKLPTIAAAAYKLNIGQPFMYPKQRSQLLREFPAHAVRRSGRAVRDRPVAAEALDLLFILHADHEQNCSTSTVRMAASSQANPYSAIAAGISALWGPAPRRRQRGGPAHAQRDRRRQEHPGKYVDKAKDKNDPFRLMGFGHRVYKNFDPRATIIQGDGYKVLDNSIARTRRCSTSRVSSSRSHSTTSTSSQPLSERRLLLGHHLQGARHPDVDVHRHVRSWSFGWLGCALARDDQGPERQDRTAAPALHG